MAERVRPNLKRMATKVMELLEPELAADGFEILDVRVFQGGGRLQVRVYLETDSAGGITLGECAKAGRSINMLMEEADLFSGQYVMEVSSPGIRRPLRLDRHFAKAVGQRVDLKVRQANKSRRVRGELLSFDGKSLLVQPPSPSEKGESIPAVVEVNLAEVLEANVDPDFDAKDLINADRRQKKEDRKKKRLAIKRPKKNRPRARAGNRKTSAGDGDSSPED